MTWTALIWLHNEAARGMNALLRALVGSFNVLLQKPGLWLSLNITRCAWKVFFFFSLARLAQGRDGDGGRARGVHQRNGVKAKTSNSLNLVTKCWLKRLDLLPCAQALLLPVKMFSHGDSEPPPPTSPSETSLRRLRLDEEAYKRIV